MRLIDAEKLRAEYLGMPNCYNGFSDCYDKAMIVDMVDEQPTVDAVTVVRCKDCKHSVRQQIGYGCEMNYRLATNGKFYCADGERKQE